MLKVLVSGFPHAGTSFLCQLIVKMGFSPGPHRLLKAADDFNRWGYWENMVLKGFVRDATKLEAIKAIAGDAFYSMSKLYETLPFEDKLLSRRVQKCILKYEIEVYKENYMPWFYRLFPRDAKHIIIRRERDYVYKRRGKKLHRQAIRHVDFCQAYEKYYQMVNLMSRDVNVLVTHYEDFRQNFRGALFPIAEFLGLDSGSLNMEHLHSVFRPRGG